MWCVRVRAPFTIDRISKGNPITITMARQPAIQRGVRCVFALAMGLRDKGGGRARGIMKETKRERERDKEGDRMKEREERILDQREFVKDTAS